ncbi:hypothetical protein G6F68_018285 [Rhizopus microsporus]|nr:hypothetical protein G6F68_018285 [Rhizopus microsporus]
MGLMYATARRVLCVPVFGACGDMGACAVWGQHVCAEPCTRCGIGPVRFLADASGAARACVADDEHAVPAGGVRGDHGRLAIHRRF